MGGEKSRSLFDVAGCDEATNVRPDARARPMAADRRGCVGRWSKNAEAVQGLEDRGGQTGWARVSSHPSRRLLGDDAGQLLLVLLYMLRRVGDCVHDVGGLVREGVKRFDHIVEDYQFRLGVVDVLANLFKDRAENVVIGEAAGLDQATDVGNLQRQHGLAKVFNIRREAV